MLDVQAGIIGRIKGVASVAKDGFHEIQIAHETSRDKETDLDLLFWIDPRDRRAQCRTNQQRNKAMRGFGERAGIRDLRDLFFRFQRQSE